MDLDYHISPMDFTLQTQCAIIVAYQLLKGRGRTPNDKIGLETFENSACLGLNKLGLPQCFKKIIEKFIQPINAQLCHWYHKLHFRSHPILSNQGTIDLAQSTEAIVKDEKVNKLFRFTIACAYCHEEYIFRIGKQLNADEIAVIRTWLVEPRTRNDVKANWKLLAQLWLHAYTSAMNGFDKKLTGRDLQREARCDQGFEIALDGYNEVALKYFINLSSSAEIQQLILRAKCNNLLNAYVTNYSPSTYCLLFARMQMPNHRAGFYEEVLHTLRNWPYQQFFLEATRAHPSSLPKEKFLPLLYRFIEKLVGGWRDYDYSELITECWNQADLRDSNSLKTLLLFVLTSKYEPLVGVILDRITDKDKEELLMDFAAPSLCARAVREKDFGLFELFVRTLGSQNKDLLLRFRDLFDARYTYYYTAGVGDEGDIEQRRFMEIADEIIAEIDDSDEMKM